ncbi:hypothetical protein LS73_006570 [Helicobacter muridarum]|uniref:Uncharacterized protein n=1 Tax=Helicobacter muridarum TaxID=216 RepID=A0A099TXE4_9HELI|nr:hypothetical protein [Helicobacter muridarum]TLD99843.1 hypothetical protein LS73_006570 [Helicobacter muridarum]STQ86948.1 Uncharacterised protein [Helicobacter muridarum]
MSIVLLVILMLATMYYKPHWLYSTMVAMLSYIATAIASFYSISKKIKQKVIKAQNDMSKEELAQSYINDVDNIDKTSSQSSIDINDMKNISNSPKSSQQHKKDRYRKMLKFLDISKVSLGFELSFSYVRILALFFMCFGFALLIYCNLFYPIAYILGILFGVIVVVSYLLCK